MNTYLFVQDRASHHHEGYFTKRIEHGNQDSDENDTPTRETTGGGQRLVEISRANKQSQDDRETETCAELETVLNPGLELADREGFNLSIETKSVWALLRNTFLLVVKNGGAESLLVTFLLGLMGLVLPQ